MIPEMSRLPAWYVTSSRIKRRDQFPDVVHHHENYVEYVAVGDDDC